MRQPEYQVWVDMRHRCLSPKSPIYKNYGGRGITICLRWGLFKNFLEDMGPRPGNKREYTLERIENDKGYSPSNCKWATWEEQGQNRRARIRSPQGEEQGQSKLTEEDVRYIRAYFRPNKKPESPHSAFFLAAKFGIHWSGIYRIIRRKSWRHIL